MRHLAIREVRRVSLTVRLAMKFAPPGPEHLYHFILYLKWYYLLDVFSVQDIDRYRNIMAIPVCPVCVPPLSACPAQAGTGRRANGTGRGRETHNSL